MARVIPTTLNNRQIMCALLDASGYKAKDISEKLGMHTTTIAVLRQSPLYKLQVDRLRREILEHGTMEVAERINREAPKSVETMVELRDNYDGETPHAVRLAAAKEFVDRVVPKVNKTVEDKTINISFTQPEMMLIASVMAEAGLAREIPKAIDVTPAQPQLQIEDNSVITPKSFAELEEEDQQLAAAGML